jgi:hypothetical protein
MKTQVQYTPIAAKAGIYVLAAFISLALSFAYVFAH